MDGIEAVEMEDVRKRYRNSLALDGLSLNVRRGAVCGLLGPNGAGKTTAVRILATLLGFDEGRARVGGYDVVRQAEQVRYTIGLVGQNAAVDEVLTGHQNLVMFGRLYQLDRRAARQRADELLAQFQLEDAAGKPVKAYSGGMRRRLDLAASMILAPSVLFLDEPTVGLDPRARNEVWRSIRAMADAGTSVLLTTQYLDEADRLASQIYLIDSGRVIAEGTPDELKSRIGGDRIEVVLREGRDLAAAREALATLSPGEPSVDEDDRRISFRVRAAATALPEVVRLLDALDVRFDDLAMRQPTLDDAFLQLTGRASTAIDQLSDGVLA